MFCRVHLTTWYSRVSRSQVLVQGPTARVRDRLSAVHAAAMATNVLKCPLCGSLSLTFKLYVSHLRLVHSKDPSFHIMCEVGGCREVFRAFSAFNSHVYRHHRAAIGVDTEAELMTCGTADELAGPSLQLQEFAPRLEDDFNQIDSASYKGGCIDQKEDSQQHLQAVTSAKFLLQLREGRQISQVDISDVMNGCRTLCKQAVSRIKDGVKSSLASAGINCEDVPGLMDVLSDEPDPFRCTDTNYRFEKFCVEHLGCLVRPMHVHMHT